MSVRSEALKIELQAGRDIFHPQCNPRVLREQTGWRVNRGCVQGNGECHEGVGVIAAFDILLLLSTLSVGIHILFDQRNYRGLTISWMISVHTVLLRFYQRLFMKEKEEFVQDVLCAE